MVKRQIPEGALDNKFLESRRFLSEGGNSAVSKFIDNIRASTRSGAGRRALEEMVQVVSRDPQCTHFLEKVFRGEYGDSWSEYFPSQLSDKIVRGLNSFSQSPAPIKALNEYILRRLFCEPKVLDKNVEDGEHIGYQPRFGSRLSASTKVQLRREKSTSLDTEITEHLDRIGSSMLAPKARALANAYASSPLSSEMIFTCLADLLYPIEEIGNHLGEGFDPNTFTHNFMACFLEENVKQVGVGLEKSPVLDSFVYTVGYVAAFLGYPDNARNVAMLLKEYEPILDIKQQNKVYPALLRAISTPIIERDAGDIQEHLYSRKNPRAQVHHNLLLAFFNYEFRELVGSIADSEEDIESVCETVYQVARLIPNDRYNGYLGHMLEVAKAYRGTFEFDSVLETITDSEVLLDGEQYYAATQILTHPSVLKLLNVSLDNAQIFLKRPEFREGALDYTEALEEGNLPSKRARREYAIACLLDDLATKSYNTRPGGIERACHLADELFAEVQQAS